MALVSTPPSSAATPTAVPFACFNNPSGAGCSGTTASFHGFASGDEIHVGAVTAGTTTLADVEQAFSSATANSQGLASQVVGDDGGLAGTGLQLQPPKSATNHSYASGAGVTVGLGAAANGSTNQVKLAGLASQVAPPNSAAQVVSIPSASCPLTSGVPECLQLVPGVIDLARAGVLTGEAAAVYDTSVCPLGQPLSYGLGDAADANLLDYNQTLTNTIKTILANLQIAVPTTGSVVVNHGDARTNSETFISPNGDGTFGLTTVSQETIAPVSINLFGLADLELVVEGQINPTTHTANPANPVTLITKTTGEGSGAETKLVSNDLVTLTIQIPGNATPVTLIPPTSLDDLVGAGGIDIVLNPHDLLSELATTVSQNPVLNQLGSLGTTLGKVITQIQNSGVQKFLDQLPNQSLGEIAVGTPVRAINSDPASKQPGTPTPLGVASSSEGTNASAAFDLARVDLAPAPNAILANLYIGHLEAESHLTSPISCSLPIIKTSDPSSVTAGHSFDYNIYVPDPSKLDLIDCNLENVTVTDKISDSQGTPSFTVTSAHVVEANGQAGPAGAITDVTGNTATVTWTGLSYTVAKTGSPPNPPIHLDITVSVPGSSSAGVIQDIVTATGTANGCQGGTAGSTDTSATSANGTALTGSFTLQAPSVTAAGVSTTAAKKSLPFTGAMGGLWQPIGALAALGIGGGALALVRRSRRMDRS